MTQFHQFHQSDGAFARHPQFVTEASTALRSQGGLGPFTEEHLENGICLISLIWRSVSCVLLAFALGGLSSSAPLNPFIAPVTAKLLGLLGLLGPFG